MRNAVIYKMIFPCGHFYIGSAVNYPKRKSNHVSDMRIGRHPNINIQRHFGKYGIPSFVVLKTVEEVTNLIQDEQKAINEYKPYLNILSKAGNSLGYRHSDSIKKLIAELSVKKAQDKAWIQKVSKGWFKKNRIITEEERQLSKERMLLNNPFKGKKHNLETRKIMSEKARNREHFQSTKHFNKFIKAGIEASRKPVIQMDINGSYIAEFNSLTEAVAQFNTKQTKHLASVCDGKKGTYNGYKWQFKNGKQTEYVA